MIIKAKYHIWTVAAEDDARPVLGNVLIEATGEPNDAGERDGVAVAADGFMLAVVPVTLERNDVPGLIHREAFDHMLKILPPRKRDHDDVTVTLDLQEGHLRLLNDVRLPRGYMAKDVSTFPNWREVVTMVSKRPTLPRVYGESESPYLEFGDAHAFNHKLLTTICRAIGTEHIRLTQLYRANAMLVEPQNTAYPEPPYGVLMPMHANHIAGLRARWKLPAADVQDLPAEVA